MAAIVIIHGINNQRQGPHSRKADWLPRLKDGIELGRGKGYRLPTEDDVEVAFWGDLFRPKAKMLSSSAPPPLGPRDLTEDGEQELLRLLLAEAEATGAVPPKDPRALAGEWVHAALHKLSRTAFFRGIYGDDQVAERWLVFGLKQVHRYMHDPGTYEAVQKRVDETLSDDTRVVIGHSLGSVVAYEALCRNPRHVQTLITLGSPLGVPTLIHERLRPADGWVQTSDGKRIRIRPRVEHWFNAADKGDLVALVKRLAPLFEPGLRDIEVSTGRTESHAIEKYLTDAAVGQAVCTGWR